MKKLLTLTLIGLMVGTAAFAQTPPASSPKTVKCDVNGVVKRVKGADACTAMGGKVVPPKTKVTKTA